MPKGNGQIPPYKHHRGDQDVALPPVEPQPGVPMRPFRSGGGQKSGVYRPGPGASPQRMGVMRKG